MIIARCRRNRIERWRLKKPDVPVHAPARISQTAYANTSMDTAAGRESREQVLRC